MLLPLYELLTLSHNVGLHYIKKNVDLIILSNHFKLYKKNLLKDELILFSTKIYTIPKSFETLNLVRLELDHCNLVSLKNISSQKNLKTLDVSFNYISKIPNDICYLPLKTLNISYNYISKIPKKFKKLNLNYLNISYNNFKLFHKFITLRENKNHKEFKYFKILKETNILSLIV
jgi:Leucine-rich repeat (LRR) protein